MKLKALLPIILMVLLALTRWPGFMPWNFSAVYALMFCAGVYFPKRLVWWLPICTLLVSDLLLNIYYHSNFIETIMSPDMIGNYLAYGVLLWLGRRFTAKSSFLALLVGGFLGALMFYVVTNTLSWLINPFHNPEYTKTFTGWLIAMTKGTEHYNFPIRMQTWEMFRNTLASGGLFTALFAGAMKAADAMEPVDEEAPAEEKSQEAPDSQPKPEEAKAS